jgi:hypothetical protein
MFPCTVTLDSGYSKKVRGQLEYIFAVEVGVKIAVLFYVIDNINDSIKLLIFYLIHYCDILS